MFQHGKPAVCDTIRDYLLSTVPVDNLHMLCDEKGSSVGIHKAREHCMRMPEYRDILGVRQRASGRSDIPAFTRFSVLGLQGLRYLFRVCSQFTF